MKVIKWVIVYYSDDSEYSYTEECLDFEKVCDNIIADEGYNRIKTIIPIYGW